MEFSLPDDVHAHDDKTVCLCGCVCFMLLLPVTTFLFPRMTDFIECRSVYELKITFIIKSSRVFKIGPVISFSLSSDEDTKKKQF